MVPGTEPTPAVIWMRRATVAAGAAVLAIAIVAGFWFTGHTLALLFAAIVVGEAVTPLVDRLSRWMPRGLVVLLLYLALVALLALAIWFIAPRIVEQGQQLISDLPSSSEEAEESLAEIGVDTDADIWTTVQDNIGRFTTVLVSIPIRVVSSVAEIVLISFMSAYWLVARDPLRSFLTSLVPDEKKPGMNRVMTSMSATVGGYVRGVGIGAVIVGVGAYIGLAVLGVQFAAILAVLAAFGEVIPIVGPIVTAIPAIVVAFLDSPTLALLVAIYYLVLQQVESNLIVPNVMSSQADIPPILVIAAISAGGGIGGILGAVIAIPLVGIIRVLILQIAAPGIRNWTGAEEPAPQLDPEADDRGAESLLSRLGLRKT